MISSLVSRLQDNIHHTIYRRNSLSFSLPKNKPKWNETTTKYSLPQFLFSLESFLFSFSYFPPLLVEPLKSPVVICACFTARAVPSEPCVTHVSVCNGSKDPVSHDCSSGRGFMVSAASVLSSLTQLTSRTRWCWLERHLVSLVLNKYTIEQKEFCYEFFRLMSWFTMSFPPLPPFPYCGTVNDGGIRSS